MSWTDLNAHTGSPMPVPADCVFLHLEDTGKTYRSDWPVSNIHDFA